MFSIVEFEVVQGKLLTVACFFHALGHFLRIVNRYVVYKVSSLNNVIFCSCQFATGRFKSILTKKELRSWGSSLPTVSPQLCKKQLHR